jgi:ribonuclease E
MSQLEVPDGMSIIARTAGIGRDATELQWDLSYLLQLWKAIDEAAKGNSAPLLIYLESSLVIRAIRDYFQPDIGEILIDTDDIYEQAAAFMSVVMPDNLPRVKRYQDDVPLFSRFQIEHQIETAYSRTVPLPSGGAIVIDHTEALVSVDVNSARATRGSDIEETATRTNLEAADEIARQARLRDLGGLIVIDFIDMESSKAQKDVENRLRDALRHDRARVQMGKISKFGLMEMSRQRLRPALSEGSHVTCPRCNGTGHIRDTESSALQVLRIIQEEAMKENTAAIHTQVPVEVAAFLLNEKRAEVIKIETRFKVNVLMVPNKHLETPHYKLERLRHDDPRLDDQKASYVMAEEAARELETDTTVSKKDADVKTRPEAAVKGITPTQPAPISQPRPTRADKTATESSGGFFGFIKKLFSSSPAVEAKPASSNNRGRNQGRNGDRNRGRNRRGERPAANAAEGASAEGNNNRNGNRNNRNGNRNQGNQNGPKPERQANTAAVTPATEATPGNEAATGAEGEERRGRGRNRRGRGRNKNDRGERAEKADAASNISNTSAAPSASPFAGPPVGMAGASASMPIQNIVNSFGNAKPATEKQERSERTPRPPRQSNRPAQNAAAPATSAPTAVTPITTTVEVIAKPAPELPKVSFQALEETPLHSVVQSAGMIWVATDAAKHVEAQNQIQAEPVAHNLGRTPKPASTLPEGPMVLVETGGQEKTV